MNNTRVIVRRALSAQRDVLEAVEQMGDEGFEQAAEILSRASKVITTGIGKSGFIARKMAASLNSVKVPAVYVHPVDALHGDSGILEPDDVVVAFSKSGETTELLKFCQLVSDLKLRVVGITSRQTSSLANQCSIHVLAPYQREYDLQSILPTASSSSALLIADILTVATAELRGDVASALKNSHPQGMIGRLMLQTVEDVMHSAELMPIASPEWTLHQCIEELSAKNLGLVCFCDKEGGLLGVITDGDVRRFTQDQLIFSQTKGIDVMSSSPITVGPSDTLHDALNLMENREMQISVLPVLRNGKLVGVVRIHDVVRSNI